ncbi:MAG: flavin reductase family protein [Candidatus Acidiferrales bacterium]
MQVTTAEFRKALGHFATGVTVITVRREDETVHGMTANSFTSVSLDPLEILVCVDRRALTYRYIRERKNFAVNILSEDQAALARFFARPEQDPATAQSLGIEFQATERGTPVLPGSLVQLDCKLADAVEAGDHTIFIGEVVDMSAQDGRPLLFHHGQFKRLGDADPL